MILFQTFSLNKWNTCYPSFPFSDLFYPPSFFLCASFTLIFNSFCLSTLTFTTLSLSLPLNYPFISPLFYFLSSFFPPSVFWIYCFITFISVLGFTFTFLALNFERQTHTTETSDNKYTHTRIKKSLFLFPLFLLPRGR